MYRTLRLDYADETATLTLNRPEKRNAISAPMISELLTALDEIEKRQARVVIMTGAGTSLLRGHGSGDALRAMAQQSPQENQDDSRRMAKMFRRIWSFSKPMIAAVNGAALAGGCGIATLCDFTLAVPEAKFGYTEVKIGFLPAIVSVFLTRQIGDKRATRSAAHRPFSAQRKKQNSSDWSSEIVAREKLMERARNWPDMLIASESQQPYSRQAFADFRGMPQRGRRPGTRDSGECAHPLHAGLQRRDRFVPGKTQTRLEHDWNDVE